MTACGVNISADNTLKYFSNKKHQYVICEVPRQYQGISSLFDLISSGVFCFPVVKTSHSACC